MNKHHLALVIGAQVASVAVAFALGFNLANRTSGAKASEGTVDCPGRYFKRELCSTTASDLTAQPRAYEGKVIQVAGFLTIDGGMLSLYPNEQYYRLGINQPSIRVRASGSSQRKLFETYGYSYVTLIGEFTHLDSGALKMGRAGSMQFMDALPIKERPRKEGLNDLRIDVDDLDGGAGS